MKTRLLAGTCVLTLGAILAPHATMAAPANKGVKLPAVGVSTALRIECRDPAAYRIKYSILRKTGKFTARVRIAGIIKNLGNAPYISNTGQQTATLYEGSRAVRTINFTNLRPNQSLGLNYTRNWNTAHEFPPTYKLVISYDPDIRMDSNPKNDDCRMNNNVRESQSMVLNDMIHRYVQLNPAAAAAVRKGQKSLKIQPTLQINR